MATAHTFTLDRPDAAPTTCDLAIPDRLDRGKRRLVLLGVTVCGTGMTVIVTTNGRAGAVRTGFAVATVLALAAVVLFVDGPFVNVRTPIGILTVLVLWAGPAGVYRFAVRTVAGSVVVGLLLVLAAPLLLRAVIQTDSSTAGIGVLVLPMMFWAGLAVAVIFETVVSEVARGRPR